MKNCKSLVLLSALAIIALAAGSANADNILINSDFETGDLTGWQVLGGNASCQRDHPDPRQRPLHARQCTTPS